MKDGRIRLAIRGSLLSSTASHKLRWVPDGLLLVNASGKIDYAGPFSGSGYRGPQLDVRKSLVLPGFVDAHVHYPQTRIIGSATGPLLEWLSTSVFPEEARLHRRAYADAVAREFVARLLACGTTTAGVFSSSSPVATDALFRQLEACGLRAVVGLTLMDRRAPKNVLLSHDKAMAACRKLVRRFHQLDDGRLQFAVTPRFAISCSRRLLRSAGRFSSENDLLVQTHIGESKAEQKETLMAHPYAKDYLDVYQQAGLVGKRTVLAHAIHLSASEWRRVADSGTSVAHCPDSNFFLGSGRMPLHRAHALGINVALGSDVAAGRSFSMRRAMSSAYDTAIGLGQSISLAELLYSATLGGARALGLDDRIGSLEKGKDADFVIWPTRTHRRTRDRLLAELVFDCDDMRGATCYVRGTRLDGFFPTPS